MRFARLFRIQRGDGRRVALVVGVMFAASAALTIGESGVDALFFDRVGAQVLPAMYLLQRFSRCSHSPVLSGGSGRAAPTWAPRSFWPRPSWDGAFCWSRARASVILDLYHGFYGGEPLRPGDRILSFDAKPSIQARGRVHETLPAAPGRAARVEHEYLRHGALALLAGLDVHTGKVFASTPGTTGIVPFMDLVGQVMEHPEYRNAPPVLVIVDNGPDHRGKAAIERLRKAHPNAVMIRTPVHASWLKQIVRHEVAVRREALEIEGGARPPRWAVAAAGWELGAA